jgi:hypothetical protein
LKHVAAVGIHGVELKTTALISDKRDAAGRDSWGTLSDRKCDKRDEHDAPSN